jgi:transcriptional regulator with XRE-family HTH domain
VDTPRAADVGDVDRWWIHLERRSASPRARMEALEIGSYEELAQRSGLDRKTVYRHLNRQQEPGVHSIQPLRDALEVDAEELLHSFGYRRC